MNAILKYTLLTAIRDKLYVGLLVILAIAFGLSNLLGSTALAEEDQTAIVYIAGSSRIIFAIGIILFVCLLVLLIVLFTKMLATYILSGHVRRRLTDGHLVNRYLAKGHLIHKFSIFNLILL